MSDGKIEDSASNGIDYRDAYRSELQDKLDEEDLGVKDEVDIVFEYIDSLREAHSLFTSDKQMRTIDLLTAARETLTEIAENAEENEDGGDVKAVQSRATSHIAGKDGLASRTNKEKQVLKDRLLSEVQEMTADSVVEEFEDNPDRITLEGDKIGYDELFERHLRKIVKRQKTDVSRRKPSFKLVLDEPEGVNGKAIFTVPGGKYQDFLTVMEEVASHSEFNLARKTASGEIVRPKLEDCDMEMTESAYARASIGPESRPWGDENWRFPHCMEDLVKKNMVVNANKVGPLTEAWEKLKDAIESETVVTDLDDAVVHGAMFWNEAKEEIWIPSSKIADACDWEEATRDGMASELYERGVVSDELEGETVSQREKVVVGGVKQRCYFWRLDASRDSECPAPEPKNIEPSLSRGMPGSDSDGSGQVSSDGPDQFGGEDDEDTAGAAAGGDNE